MCIHAPMPPVCLCIMHPWRLYRMQPHLHIVQMSQKRNSADSGIMPRSGSGKLSHGTPLAVSQPTVHPQHPYLRLTPTITPCLQCAARQPFHMHHSADAILAGLGRKLLTQLCMLKDGIFVKTRARTAMLFWTALHQKDTAP